MGPALDPVVADQDVPARADVVIVGGGIVGVSASLFLAERGLKVALVEKGEIGCEQSSRNWGWVRQADRDAREFELIREALKLWRGLNERIGADTGFRQRGIFYAARDDRSVSEYRDWVRRAGESGIDAEIVEGDAARAVMTGDVDPPAAGLLCRGDGCAEPQWAAPRIATAARNHGAVVLTGCAVRGIETAAGKVVAAVTERGTIATDTVVIAAGAWSRRLLKDLGVTIPQLKVRASVCRTTPVTGGPDACFWDGVLGVRKRADGGLNLANGLANVSPISPDHFRFMIDFLPALAMDWRNLTLTVSDRFIRDLLDWPTRPYDRPSPYEACRILDPKPDMRFLRKAFATLARRFPDYAGAGILQAWGGMIDVMPDVIPVISPVERLAGLVIATGFSGHGFGIGPGAGHLVADLVTGAKPIADPKPFRLSRFSERPRPRPESRL